MGRPSCVVAFTLLVIVVMAAVMLNPVVRDRWWMGPACNKACDLRNDPDSLKAEVACQRCCSEQGKDNSPCYAGCARGKLPVDCDNPPRRIADTEVAPCSQ